MSNYDVYCDEHQIMLQPDGSCKWCRNADGKPFILDMQSLMLVKRGSPIPTPRPEGYPKDGI